MRLCRPHARPDRHTPLLAGRHFRVMAADRVPGVKTVAGSPVKQGLTPAAAEGAARLAALVKKQKEDRQRDIDEAAERTQRAAGSSSAAAAATSTGGRLAEMLGMLSETIDGQHMAKDVVARALRRRVLKLDDTDRPLRLLFAGPSGVGKTAMAEQVCKALLGSCVEDRNFKRFNLSEFSHPSKFNRLTGGDPNYVGYKEGGELTNFVRQAEDRRAKRLSGAPEPRGACAASAMVRRVAHGHGASPRSTFPRRASCAAGVDHTSCVLLLDEVDRAADGLLTFLMNFLDQGQLTGGNGETVDARRAVILMTTNCGQGAINQLGLAAATPRREPPAAAADGSASDGGEAGGGGQRGERGAADGEAGEQGAAAGAAAAELRSKIVGRIREDVLRDICDGRWENLGRLGVIVPFLPLDRCAPRRRPTPAPRRPAVDRALTRAPLPLRGLAPHRSASRAAVSPCAAAAPCARWCHRRDGARLHGTRRPAHAPPPWQVGPVAGRPAAARARLAPARERGLPRLAAELERRPRALHLAALGR